MVTDCVIGHLSMMSLAFKNQILGGQIDVLQKVFWCHLSNNVSSMSDFQAIISVFH